MAGSQPHAPAGIFRRDEQYVSDGVNFVQNVTSSNNGFQFHDTEDYSITNTFKLHAAYNWERVDNESQMNNIYYNPGGTIPYPTPLYNHGHNQFLTLNLTKTVGSSLTNELVVSGLFYFQPVAVRQPHQSADHRHRMGDGRIQRGPSWPERNAATQDLSV